VWSGKKGKNSMKKKVGNIIPMEFTCMILVSISFYTSALAGSTKGRQTDNCCLKQSHLLMRKSIVQGREGVWANGEQKKTKQKTKMYERKKRIAMFS